MALVGCCLQITAAIRERWAFDKCQHQRKSVVLFFEAILARHRRSPTTSSYPFLPLDYNWLEHSVLSDRPFKLVKFLVIKILPGLQAIGYNLINQQI